MNVEPNHTTLAGHDHCHDLWMASIAGMLGSVDANTGDPLLGWDTDQVRSHRTAPVRTSMCTHPSSRLCVCVCVCVCVCGDQFPMDIKNATLAMQIILNQGGLAPGGLNFDAKVRQPHPHWHAVCPSALCFMWSCVWFVCSGPPGVNGFRGHVHRAHWRHGHICPRPS